MYLSESEQLSAENESISNTLGCIPYHNIVPVNHSVDFQLLRDVPQSLASLDMKIKNDYLIELGKMKD